MFRISDIENLFPKSEFIKDTQKFSDSLKEEQKSEEENE